MFVKLNGLLNNYKKLSLEEETPVRRKRLLNILLFATAVCIFLALIILLVAAAFGNAGSPEEIWLLSLAILVTSIGTLMIYIINRYASGVLASILFLMLLIIAVAISDQPYRVVDGRGLLMFAIPILTASVLLRPWASFIAAAVCSVVIGFLGIVYVKQPVPNLPGMLGFFLLAVVSWLSANSLERAMFSLKINNERLMESGQQLKIYQTELEDLVEMRTQELKEAQAKTIQQERLAVLGKLAGSVAHELRNPLGVITNAIYYLKFILMDVDEKEKEYLELIETEAQIAASIISDLLNFTQPSTTNPYPTSISTLIEAAVTRHPPPENINLVLDIPKELPNLNVDLSQMSLVLDHLFTNAYQAMPQGGRLNVICKPASKTFVEESAEWVTISVKDTGSGIPPENMPLLFEPLFSTKINGIGLGLPISKKIVEMNGGKISAKSETGKGSIFTLLLPAKSNQTGIQTPGGKHE